MIDREQAFCHIFAALQDHPDDRKAAAWAAADAISALQRLEAALAPLTEEEDAWQMLIELYRVLVLAGAGSSEKRHRYSFSRNRDEQRR